MSCQPARSVVRRRKDPLRQEQIEREVSPLLKRKKLDREQPFALSDTLFGGVSRQCVGRCFER